MEMDIRWQQRFQNFEKACAELHEACQKKTYSKLERGGLIQAFEFTHELAWNTIKDFFEYQGNTSIMGSRDAIREAFKRGLIEDGELWMDMIKSRNLSSHTYNEDIANQISQKIIKNYLDSFQTLKNKLGQLKNEQNA